jgi:hypothetical protein
MAPTKLKDISSGPDCGFTPDEAIKIRSSSPAYDDEMVEKAILLINKIIGSPDNMTQRDPSTIYFDTKSPAYFEKFSNAVDAIGGTAAADIILKVTPEPATDPFQINVPVTVDTDVLRVTVSVKMDKYDGLTNQVSVPKVLVKQAIAQMRDALPEQRLLSHIKDSQFLQKKLLEARSSYIEQEGWKKHGDTNVFLSLRLKPDNGSDLLTVMLLKMLRKGLERASYEHVKNKTEEVYKESLDQKAYPFPDIEVVNKLLESNPTASDILNLQCLISAGLNTITWYDRKTSYGTAKRYVKKAASYVPALNRFFSRRSNRSFTKAAVDTRLQGLTRRRYRDLRRTRAANAASFRRKSYRDMQMDDALDEINKLLTLQGQKGLANDPRTVLSKIMKKVNYFLRHGGEKNDPKYTEFNALKKKLLDKQNSEGRTRLETIFDSLLNPFNVGGKNTKQHRNTQRRKTRRQTLHSRR